MVVRDHETLQELVGRDLSAVTFLLDYLQLWFDGPCLNVMNTMEVSSNGIVSRVGDDQFRNLVCDQISRLVSAVHLDSTQLSIEFGDDRLVVLLGDEHYSGPEAIYYHGFSSGKWGVVRPDFE